MSRIFLSHSSTNNASAVALAQWLKREGWGDYFLDIDPAGDLSPGQRWQEALKNAAHRCEAVIFMISPAWIRSTHCTAEFMLAKQLGKRIFGVVIETTPFADIPGEMTFEWQLCDLVNGTDREDWMVQDPKVPPATVSFPTDGLTRLKHGLKRAGLDASTFVWPPLNEPDRIPYRGLKSLDVDDCAVYFGRESAIVRGLDELRSMRSKGTERLLVVLGASGSGKSSFIRAGIWPRLDRDDLHFVPLQVIRPFRAAMTGDSGLIAALEEGLRRFDIRRTRADITAALKQNGLASILKEIQKGAIRTTLNTAEPSLVILIDQGEELLAVDGQQEAAELLSLLSSVLHAPPSVDAEARAARMLALTIVAIRSDSYNSLQQRTELDGVAMRLFDLRAMSPAEYKSVIEGPAERATAAGRTLQVEPQLTEKLLNDSEGADALPLLAFTLERLFLQYGGDGDLRLDEYEQLGGLNGAIAAAVDLAFAAPDEWPAIPRDAGTRERLLRDAFVPWLAVVDPDTAQRRRRVAKWSEIPEASRPLLERLVTARLIVRDTHDADDGKDEWTVEVAHEALLRQWPLLTSWLAEEVGQLQMLEGLRRAANDWDKNQRKDDWLIHQEARLQDAETIVQDSRFRKLLGELGQAYLDGCRALDARRKAEREEQQRRIAEAQRLTAEEQKRTARAQRLGRRLIGAVAAVVFVGAVAVILQLRYVSMQTSRVLATEAVRLFDEGDEGRALRFAVLAARPGGPVAPTPAEATAVLMSLSGEARLRTSIRVSEPVIYAEYSPDSQFVLTQTASELRVWDTRTGQPLTVRVPIDRDVQSSRARFMPDGKSIFKIVGNEGRFWDVATGANDSRVFKMPANVFSMEIASDGKHVLATFFKEDPNEPGRPDPTRRQLQICSVDARSCRAVESRLIPNEFLSALFMPDGQQVLVKARGFMGLLGVDEDASSLRRIGDAGVGSGAMPSPDGKFIASMNADLGAAPGIVDLWSTTTGAKLSSISSGLKSKSATLAFSADNRFLLLHPPKRLDPSRILDLAKGLAVDEEITARAARARPIFSPDGSVMLVLTADDVLELRHINKLRDTEDVDSPLDDARFALRQPSAITVTAFSRDGTHLLIADDEGGAGIWELPSFEPTPANELVEISALKSASFSPDGTRVVLARTIEGQGFVSTWDLKTNARITPSFQSSHDIVTIEFSKDGRKVAASGSGLTVWDAATGVAIANLPRPEVEARRLTFSEDSRKILLVGEGQAQICSVEPHGTCAKAWTHQRLLEARINADGSIAAVRNERGYVLRRVADDAPIEHPQNKNCEISSVAFSPNGIHVAAAWGDGSIRQWRPENPGAAVSLKEGAVLCDGFSSHQIIYSHDGGRLAMFDYGTLEIYDTRKGERLLQFDSQDFDVFDDFEMETFWFTSDNRFLVMFANASLKLFDLQIRMSIDSPVRLEAVPALLLPSPNGRQVLSLNSEDSKAYLRDIHELLDQDALGLISRVCERNLVGGNIVSEEDVTTAPILFGSTGEDVCHPPPLTRYWRRAIAAF